MLKKLFIFIIISLFLVSCEKEIVKVGFIGSLTGKSYEIGQSAKKGFELAIEEINAKDPSFQVVKLILDDQSSLEAGYEAINEFNKEDVKYIIGFTTSNMMPAVEFGMNEHEMLFISPTMSTIDLSKKDDLFIRICTTMEEEAQFLAHKIYDDGIRSVAIIYDMNNYLYTNDYYNIFSNTFEKLGGIITCQLGIEKPDYNKISDQIIQNSPEAILLITSSLQASELLQQLYAKNHSLDVVLSKWTLTEDLAVKAGKAANNAYGLSVIKQVDSNEYSEFYKAFLARYDETPSFASFTSYEATMTLYTGLMKTTDPYEIKELIINRTFNGIQNDYTIDEYGDADRPFYVLKIKNGILVNE